MRGKNRNSIADCLKLPQFTTMNVIDGQADLVIYSSLIFYSLTINNILNIIVLLILAGVTIVTLTGEDGLLGRAASAELEQKKQGYYEEIKMAVSEEQIERSSQLKNEAFITSLEKKLSPIKKEWVKSTKKCDSNFEEKQDDYENNLLLITTKENYEIIVDIDNNKFIANISEGSFTEVTETYKITYYANTGTGNMEVQTKNKNESIVLTANGFTAPTGKGFMYWTTASDGTGTKYDEGAPYSGNSDLNLYAIW